MPDPAQSEPYQLETHGLRVHVGKIDAVLGLLDKVFGAAKEHKKTRPQLEAAPVPYHLRLHDLHLCEDFPSFDIAANGRFPTLSTTELMEVRTVGPPLAHFS